MAAKEQANVLEAQKIASAIFGAARSRQLFGVDWRELNTENKVDYIKGFLGREVYYHQRDPLVGLTDPQLKRITYNATRQCGKTIAGDSLITLADGSLVPIKDLPPETIFEVATICNGKVTKAKAVLIVSGDKPVYENIYSTDRSITTSDDHRMYRRKAEQAYDFVRSADQLPGDHIATLASLQLKEEYPENFTEGDLRYVSFQRREPRGTAFCYDLTVIENPVEAGRDYEPNFIANGFVVHNSETMTWAQIICAIHNTHPSLDGSTKVVGLANKFSQTQIVGNRLRALLNEHYDKTRFFWDREGSTKARVVFRKEGGLNTKETGTIDYVTANPKAFSEGFTASIAFIDEANRLDAKVYSETVTPYLGSTNGTMILTGVSRGKGIFYDACNSKDFTHFHYPWDTVETYRRKGPADLVFEDGRIKEVGIYPLEVMPLGLKKVLFPTNPLVHVIPTVTQKERWVRLWELSDGIMGEEDFRSQYMLEFLADVLAVLQLYDQQLLFDSSDFEPLESGIAGENYYFGLDCGGSRNAYAAKPTNKDKAALVVWRRRGHIKEKVYCDERDDVLPEELVAWLREMCHPTSGRFKCAHGTVDVTGAVGAFASQHLKNCGIPIIPIIYNRTEEITKKNFKNAIFDWFKIENSAGRTHYPAGKHTDMLDELTMQPRYRTFFEHREQWEKIERKITTGVNNIISAPSGEHDDGPNADVLCVYGMDHPDLYATELGSCKKRARHGSIGRGLMSRGGASWTGR